MLIFCVLSLIERKNAMITVRTLINQAYQGARIRGYGDSAEDFEVQEGLYMLNDILDGLTGEPEFAPAKKWLDIDVPQCGYITFSDDQHRIVTTAVATTEEVTVSTGDTHGLSSGDTIKLNLGERGEFDLSVTEVTDVYTFVTEPIPGVEGTYSGYFKMASDGPEWDINVIGVPPVSMFQVINSDAHEMPELQEQNFFACKGDRSYDWWFYDKSPRPYPKLWIGGQGRVRVVFTEPFWNNVTLDTDLSRMPVVARRAVKEALIRDLASQAGYDDIADRHDRLFRKAFADYARNNHQTASPVPDLSAPGYLGGKYNIETDGFGNGRIF